jgi:hypothetical protein
LAAKRVSLDAKERTAGVGMLILEAEVRRWELSMSSPKAGKR